MELLTKPSALEVLASLVPEKRAGQAAMLTQVEAMLAKERGVALLEAGTGTGKTFAYLIPAILSGKTVVIATANKALQNQICDRDLPFLIKKLENFGIKSSFALVKGKGNYLCPLALYGAGTVAATDALLTSKNSYERSNLVSSRLNASDEYADWVAAGNYDLAKAPTASKLEGLNLVTAEHCIGWRQCDLSSKCDYAKSKLNQMTAKLKITNQAMLALDLSRGRESLLGEYTALIVDEAHQVSGQLRSNLGEKLDSQSVKNLYRMALYFGYIQAFELQARPAFVELAAAVFKDFFERLATAQKAELSTELSAEYAQTAKDRAEALYDYALTKGDLIELAPLCNDAIKNITGALVKKVGITKYEVCWDPAGVSKQLETLALLLSIEKQVLQNRSAAGSPFPEEKRNAYGTLASKFGLVIDNILGLMCGEGTYYYGSVRTAEFRGQTQFELTREPLKLHALTQVYEEIPVIYTSATLAVDEDFTGISAELGATGEDIITGVFPSPFDMDKQALLYLAHPEADKNLIPPGNNEDKSEYIKALAEKIWHLVSASKGRCFVLFSSYTDLTAVHSLMTRLPSNTDNIAGFPLRRQEPGVSTEELLRWYKETDNSVLMGVRSFWEGVDIQGDKLSLVIIAKQPYPVPSAPYYQKLSELLGDATFQRQIYEPHMFTLLRQGIGRAIRSLEDTAAIAILDPRFVKPNKYIAGRMQKYIHSMGFKTSITSKISDVRDFFNAKATL